MFFTLLQLGSRQGWQIKKNYFSKQKTMEKPEKDKASP